MISCSEPGAQTLCACAGSASTTAPKRQHARAHPACPGRHSSMSFSKLLATQAPLAASILEVVSIPDLDPNDVGDGAAAGLVAGNDHARETVRAQKVPVLLIGDDDLLAAELRRELAGSDDRLIAVTADDDDDLAQDVVLDVGV